MKRVKLLMMVVISAVLMTSCVGFSSNLTSNINQNQTTVVLAQNNYHIVKTVSAEVSDNYFLGFGGMKNLENNAVAELTRKANLTGSQALVNVTVKESIAVKWLLFQEISVYAEATVIEFDK